MFDEVPEEMKALVVSTVDKEYGVQSHEFTD
jgi:hypothetical protein